MCFKRDILLMVTLFSLAGLYPSSVMAGNNDPATRYDRCINKAEASLYDCLDFAVATESLCWSRYGYTKLYCTIRYFVELRRK